MLGNRTQLYWVLLEALKENKCNPTQPQMKKKNYHHPTFVQYKKSFINLFSFYLMKRYRKEKRKTN
jgi:hypothetical protein